MCSRLWGSTWEDVASFFSIDENRAAWFAPSRNVLGTVCGYAFRQWNCACAEKLVLFWISLIWLKSNFRRVVDQCSFEKKCFVRCFLCSLLLATSARLRHCLSYVRAFHCITDVCLEFRLLQQIIYQQRSSCLVTSSLDTRTTRRITRGHRKAPPQKRVYAPHKLLVLNLFTHRDPVQQPTITQWPPHLKPEWRKWKTTVHIKYLPATPPKIVNDLS